MNTSTSSRKKRRSSKRLSLVATLQNLTNEGCEDKPTDAQSSNTDEPTAKVAKEDPSCQQHEEKSTVIMHEADKLCISQLQGELDEWTKLLDKYRNPTDTEIDEDDSIAFEVPLKHQHQAQQIDELEKKFDYSMAVIGNFIENFKLLKAEEALKLDKMNRRLYDRYLEKFDSTDPRVIISKIFELHQDSESTAES